MDPSAGGLESRRPGPGSFPSETQGALAAPCRLLCPPVSTLLAVLKLSIQSLGPWAAFRLVFCK